MELLMERNQTTVSRTELLERVWGDEFSNDQGLTQAISRLRGVLSSNSKASIRTIPKKGYMLEFEPKPAQPGITISYRTLLIVFLVLVIFLLVFVQRIEIRVDEINPDRIDNKKATPTLQSG